MPYIEQKSKDKLVKLALGDLPTTAGELNYLITILCIAYKNNQGLSYKTINDIVGALEGAKLEFYRRVAIPYENIKISENGDVYE